MTNEIISPHLAEGHELWDKQEEEDERKRGRMEVKGVV